MLILSRVCAEFRDRAGNTLFNIGPHDLLSFLEAPEAIREDPLFALLQEDGSLEAVRSIDRQKQLEAEPGAGINAEGRKIRQEKTEAEQEGPGTGEAGPEPEVAGEAAGVDAAGDTASAEAAAKTSAPAKAGRKSTK